MRKLFLISVLSLIGAAVFAQNAPAPTIAFTGALYTGTIAQSIGGSTPSLGIWDPVNQTMSRFNFQGTINGGTWGLNFRLREDDNWQQNYDSNEPSFRRLYGWLEPLPGVIRVVVGRLSGYEWATGDAGGFSTLGNFDGAVGAQLQIKPIDGLNFGFFLPFTYGLGGTDYVSSEELVQALDTMAFGAKYTMKGVGDIEAGYWLTPSWYPPNTGNSNFYEYPLAWFGLEYVGTPNLVALLESQFALSSNWTTNWYYLDEEVSYQLNQIGLTLYAEQLIWDPSAIGVNSGTFLGFRPVVDYTMGNVDVGAYGELMFTTNTTTSYSGQVGYAFGPFVKVTVAKNVYMQLQPEFGGGSVTPPVNGAPLQDYPDLNGSPGYQAANGLTQGFAPLHNSYWQVFLNFVVSF
jgi:hypothetical protein